MKTVALLVLLTLGASTVRSPAAPASARPAPSQPAMTAAALPPTAKAVQSGAQSGPMSNATRTSASYTLVAETLDAGGAPPTAGAVLTSAGGSYTIKDPSLGAVGALATFPASASVYTLKGGYAGQLYEVLGLAVTAPATSVNEGASVQLGAAPLLDDNTLLAALPASGLSWSVMSGPIASVSVGGLATAATVYQNTPATVRATSGGLSGTGTLTVLNINNDDYGSYAGDGIDDAWQVAYFGMSNPKAGPNVDADGTGQTNLFKYLAGLNPLDPASRFVLSIAKTAGQPSQCVLTFSPVYSGRTYTVQATSSLTQSNWTTLTNTMFSVAGTTETVTDPNAATGPRFYRVQVSMP